MRMTKEVLLCLVLFVSLSLAHDTMTYPVPRNGGVPQASTSPCDRPSGTGSTAPMNVQSGAPLKVEWQNNHETGTFSIGIAPASSDTNVASYRSLANFAASNSQPQDQSVTIPSDLSLGLYTLRWSWPFGGSNYMNCADLRVTGTPPANSVAGGESPITNQALSDGQYRIMDGSKAVGVYDSYTGSTTCIQGYTASDNQCTTGAGSLTPGGKAGLAIFFIFLIVGGAVGAIFFIKKKKPVMYTAWKARLFKSSSEAKGAPARPTTMA